MIPTTARPDTLSHGNQDPVFLLGSLERILLLYDEALNSLTTASGAIAAHDEEAKAESLANTLTILMELRGGLDHSVSPELTRNLDDLYTYSINRVYAANRYHDGMAVEQAARVLEILRAAWAELRPQVSV